MSTIKNLLLNACKTDLAAITGIRGASLNPARIPMIGDIPILPWTCIFDEDEPPVKYINRFDQHEFVLHIETWTHVDKPEDLSDALDELHGQTILKIFDQSSTYLQYRQNTEEIFFGKTIVDDNEGAIVNKYKITYRTIHGNPYLMNI